MSNEAHEQYWDDLGTMISKGDGWAKIEPIERKGKTFVVVYGRHSSLVAADMLEQSRSYISEFGGPSKWVIFVEGISSGLPVDMIRLPEVRKCLQISKEEGVPAFDPIINTHQKTVIDEFRKSKTAADIGQDTITDYLIWLEYLSHGKDEVSVNLTAKRLNLEPDFIKQRIDVVVKAASTEGGWVMPWTREEIYKELTDISNRFSQTVLEYYLRKNPGKKYCLASIGAGHLPIFQNVSSENAKDNKLAEHLLLEREKQGKEFLALELVKLLSRKTESNKKE